MTTPRGFVALLPVLALGTTLVSFAAAASQDAFSLRLSVLHAEYAVSADAAARSCATSVLLRLAQAPGVQIRAEEVLLARGASCFIEGVEVADHQYRVETSARAGDAEVRVQTNAYLEQGEIVRVFWREI